MITIPSQIDIPSQVDVSCKNVLCTNIRAFVLFGINDKEDEHVVETECFYTIKLRKGLLSKTATHKLWKLRVPTEGKLWSSEAEVKDIIKDCFKEFTLLYPPPVFDSFSKK